MSSSRSLVVEFVGLPGVGKSHVSSLLAARMSALGAPVRSTYLRINHELRPWQRVIRKCLVSSAELARQPGTAWRLGAAAHRSGQRARIDLLRLPFNWLVAQALVRRGRSRPGAELLDEGIVQALWSFGLAGDDRAVASCARAVFGGNGRAVPMPDVVVVVDAPVEMILARLESRRSRDGRVDRMDAPQRRAALLRGERVLAAILSEELGVVGGASGPAVRRVANSDPACLEADIDTLARELAALVA